MTLPSSTPRVWNYWMWDESGKYQYKYDHAMDDHPDHEFLRGTAWEESWSKKFFWSAKEAALLSFGRSPTKVSWDDSHSGVQQADGDSEFATHACSVLRKIAEAQAKNVLPEHVPAMMYVEWAHAYDVPFPPDLADKVKSHYELVMSQPIQSTEQISPRENPEIEGKINSRLKNNMLRVIWAIAREKYRYPEQPGAARKIRDTVDRQGVDVSEDTIHNWLKEGEKLSDVE